MEYMKPCPFCGGKPVIIRMHRMSEFLYYAAKCSNCGMEKVIPFPNYFTTEEIDRQIAKYWNTRYDEHMKGESS